MEDKHPIDKLFRDGFNNADIPFDEGDWTALSRKMHPRKRRLPIIWIGSGVAAAVILAAILLFRESENVINEAPHREVSQQPVITPPAANDSVMPHDTHQVPVATPLLPSASLHPPASMPAETIGSPLAIHSVKSGPTLARVQTLGQTAGIIAIANNTTTLPGIPVARTVAPSAPLHSASGHSVPAVAAHPEQGWILSIMAAPDLSGTRPLDGKFSGNVGLVATYRLNNRLSISGGVIYARKLYQTDFANYRPSYGWSNPQRTPSFVDADCNVLDIPLNINFDIAHQRRSAWFASAGISSYLMLKETYDYTYPPHEYGYPKQFTLHNQNRHILGIGNVSIGYRRQLNSTLRIAVQPFVKVPLTGIGNGNLKLYSTGVALSADIDLTGRTKR